MRLLIGVLGLAVAMIACGSDGSQSSAASGGGSGGGSTGSAGGGGGPCDGCVKDGKCLPGTDRLACGSNGSACTMCPSSTTECGLMLCPEGACVYTPSADGTACTGGACSGGICEGLDGAGGSAGGGGGAGSCDGCWFEEEGSEPLCVKECPLNYACNAEKKCEYIPY